jgi:DNA-binding MarR family transcriptional regulator
METESTRTGAHRTQTSTWAPITRAQLLCSYWLKRAERRVSTSFAPKLKASGLIASEWEVIRQLYSGSAQGPLLARGSIRLSPLDIVQALGMTKGGVSKLVNRLVKKGLIIKRVGEFDRRFRTIELTERGEALVPELARLGDDNDREIFSNLRRRYRLSYLLRRVVQARQKQRVDIWHVPRPMASLHRGRANTR